MTINTLSVASAVTPTVIETGITHYINRKPLHHKPTAHISYHVGLRLIRQFLDYASHHTVEDVQAFTAQWVPSPRWVRLEELEIPYDHVIAAAERIQMQLGPDGLKAVGGLTWWQWRPESRPLKAQWIEMRKDYHEHKQKNTSYTRSMLYVHGGAYYFGSVDEHRYQMQRHARKLQARVLAPRYRLAPQYPFPCGLLDCLATYMYLLTVQPPETIILAGDSAGGGMVVSLLVILRDQGLPLPAGAILLSPWVDLTHSFPSVAGENALDYVPPHGFVHRPSMAWPPPNSDDLKKMKGSNTTNGKTAQTEEERAQGFTMEGGENAGGPLPDAHTDGNLSIQIGEKVIEIKDQIQMYTTNALLSHPLVSPVMQPSLGGLPPLCIITGGGEMLRDEQIYLAHKAAAPTHYPPSAEALASQKPDAAETVSEYPPTYVQLQVWDDMCHVAPTLSFTRPAKFMYRSVAQFGAWALAREQNRDVAIVDDDNISVISSTSSSEEKSDDSVTLPSSNSQNSFFSSSKGSIMRRWSRTEKEEKTQPPPAAAQPTNTVYKTQGQTGTNTTLNTAIGKAGDDLPPFKHHMIRQRVSRHGEIFPLPPADQLPACTMNPSDVGVIKPGPVRKWMGAQSEWGRRYAKDKREVQQQRMREMSDPRGGYVAFEEGENPPPSAIVGRRTTAMVRREAWEGKTASKKSRGLAMWSGWGSAHDEDAIEREAMRKRVTRKIVPYSKGTKDQNASVSSFKTAPLAPAVVTEPPEERGVVQQENENGHGNGESTDGGFGLGAPLVAEKSNKRPAIGNKAFPFKLAAPLDGEVNPSTITLTDAAGVINLPATPTPQPSSYVPFTPVRKLANEEAQTPMRMGSVRSVSTVASGSSLFAGSGFMWDDESLGRPTPERVQRVDEARG